MECHGCGRWPAPTSWQRWRSRLLGTGRRSPPTCRASDLVRGDGRARPRAVWNVMAAGAGRRLPRGSDGDHACSALAAARRLRAGHPIWFAVTGAPGRALYGMSWLRALAGAYLVAAMAITLARHWPPLAAYVPDIRSGSR